MDAFGWTPAHAGETLVALFVGNLGIKPATTPLLRRFGFRTVIVGSVCGLAITVALMAALSPTTPLPLILVLLTASGVFRSTGFTAYNTVAFADVDAAILTDANTLSFAIQQLAVGLGAAAGALALRLALLVNARESYREAFVFIAAILVFPIIEGALLPSGAGGSLTRRASSPEPAASRG